MRKQVKETIEERRTQMAEGINLSKEQFQDLLAAIGNPKMNPLDQKKFDEEEKRDRRRTASAIELGRIEAEARWRKMVSCSHSRDPRTGNSVARGMGEWTTGGQVHGLDTIGLNCLRCGTRWLFKGTPQEVEFANQAGLLGFVPPPIERCLNKEDFVRPAEPDKEKLAALTA